jgi:hypothetical protein
MHGVGRDALGGVDSARVAETGRLATVVGGQPDREPVSDSQLTVPTDVGDGPAVAVFDPVGGGEAESLESHHESCARLGAGNLGLRRRGGRGRPVAGALLPLAELLSPRGLGPDIGFGRGLDGRPRS